MTVRTRIAPSPTGSPHIGTAYIALFNYAFARHGGGRFVLRIEDTDRARSTRESEQAIFEALRWLGLPWDEGPDVGGDCGPYRQSERLELYRVHAAELVAKGGAYPCFCSPERLRELRETQQAAKQETVGYDGRCAGLSAAEAARRAAAGEAHVIRLRVPAEGECAVKDRFRGEVRIAWAQVDHQVLVKADGYPTYHLANVVDDHLMEISHVIRGEEWISSTPKHLLLYERFGWTPPAFAHLPLLRNPDKSKLSKRKNPTSILYYRRAGFLPEALVNYLGLMAYSMPDGREAFTLAELAASFDLDRVHLGGPIFDLDKLRNFNGRYLRELDPEALLGRLRDWMLNDAAWRQVVPLAQPRLRQLADLVPMSAYLFADQLEYPPERLLDCGQEGDRAAALLKIAQWELEKLADWSGDGIRETFAAVSEKESLKLKDLLRLFYVAMAGSAVALPLYDSMALLGRDLAVRRIQYALDALADRGFALSGKKQKKLASYYDSAYGTP